MHISEAQRKVDDWIKKMGVRYFNELTNTVLLMEEVGELSRVIARKYGEQSFKDGEENLSLGEEISDVFFVLLCIANQTHIDLTESFKQTLLKKTKRDAIRHKNNPKLIKGYKAIDCRL